MLSSPVSNGELIFLLVGERDHPKPATATPDYGGPPDADAYAVKRVSVVALDLTGAERWVVPICPSQPLNLGGPAVVPSGNVIASCADTVYSVKPDGSELVTSTPGVPVDGTIAASAAQVVFLSRRTIAAMTSEGLPFQANATLVTLNPDLSLRWTRAVGFTTGRDLPAFTRTSWASAPALDGDGNVYAVCDTCGAASGKAPAPGDRATFSRFAPADGAATTLLPLDTAPTTVGMTLVLGGGDLVVTANGARWSAGKGTDSKQELLADDAVLAGEEGLVFLERGGEELLLHRGDAVVDASHLGATDHLGGPRARGEHFSLLSTGLALGDDGSVLFEFPDLDPESAPLVFDGLVVGRTRDQLLVGMKAEVEADAGPWPLVAGDLGGTRAGR